MKATDEERKGLPSASNWGRYEQCPGSFALERKARELGQLAHLPGTAAERGTRIHGWLAGEAVELSAEEQASAEFLLERAEEQRRRIFGDTSVAELKEKRLWLKLKGQLVASGKFDRVLYTQRLALVQDYKGGWSEPVPAEQSGQMRFLAVLVALNLPTLTEVVVQIISGPYGVSEARYSVAQLVELYRGIERTLEAIAKEDAPLSPAPELCAKCPASNICPAIKALVPLTAKALVSPLPDGARAAKLLDEIAIFEGHFAEIKKYYSQRLEEPTYRIPGYGLVTGSARREISDWRKAKEILVEFLSEDDLSTASQFRITDLERLFGKKAGLSGAALKERFNQLLGGVIAKKEPAPSLKRVNGTPKFERLEAA